MLFHMADKPEKYLRLCWEQGSLVRGLTLLS